PSRRAPGAQREGGRTTPPQARGRTPRLRARRPRPSRSSARRAALPRRRSRARSWHENRHGRARTHPKPPAPGRRRSTDASRPAGVDDWAMTVPPWKIKVVEPIHLPDAERRRAAIEEAGWNTFLLRSDDVFVDLLTDSGTSALSQEQRAAMELGDESYAGSRSFFRLEQAMHDVYGYRHLIPTHQGRGAEHLLAKVLVQPGSIVPSNLYFTTSRVHVELAGGIWQDVSIPEASDPEST